MKVVYIEHPTGGNIRSNINSVLDIVRNINLTELDVVPIAPMIIDCMALNDSSSEERQKGTNNNRYFFESGFVQELRLYGNLISRNMREKIEWAEQNNIPVVNCIAPFDPTKPSYDIDDIAWSVCDQFEITMLELKGFSRKDNLSLARHAFVGLSYELNKYATKCTELGRYLNRSHSTILHSKRVSEELYQTQKEYKALYILSREKLTNILMRSL